MRELSLLLLLSVASCAVPQRAKAQALKSTTGNLDVRGGSIYYETLGKGPAVILIHGGFGDRRMWDGQFQALATNFQVVRYDHRGFGRSPAPRESYSPVDDLLRLLEQLSIRRAHLVGNSMGGTLAIDFALKHPGRVASLVIVAAGARGIPFPQKDIDRILAVFKVAEAEGLERAAEQWLAHPMVATTKQAPGARENLRAMVFENKGIFGMKHWPSEAMNPPAAERLKELIVPTLVIIGGRDTEASRGAGEVTAKEIKEAKKIIMAEADHLPQMVNPTKFNRHLLKFWRSLSGRPNNGMHPTANSGAFIVNLPLTTLNARRVMPGVRWLRLSEERLCQSSDTKSGGSAMRVARCPACSDMRRVMMRFPN
jgi:pimeloyl-ACP methyl ester carboxylesterase